MSGMERGYFIKLNFHVFCWGLSVEDRRVILLLATLYLGIYFAFGK